MHRAALALGLLTLGTCRASARPAVAERWRLVEQLRLGSLEEGPAAFGDIRAVTVDRRNNLWVLEFGAQEIRVFDSTGRFLRTVGRKGQGPGEFVYADGLLLGKDGRVWVPDPRNGRLTAFDDDGRFVEQISAPSLGYGYVSAGGVDSTGRIWDDFVTVGTDGKGITRYRRFVPGTTQVDTVSLTECRRPVGKPEPTLIRGRGGLASIPFEPSPTAAVDFNGRLACVPWSADYDGLLLDLLTGDTLARFHGATEMIPIRAGERDSEVSRLSAFARRIGSADFSPSMVPRVKPALQRLSFDLDGRLWVRRLTLDGGTVFDVFDADGKLRATVESPFAPGYVAPVFHRDQAYFIVEGTDGVPQVVRARIERSSAPRRPGQTSAGRPAPE